ncbi:R3H domain-containing protein 4 [Lethenteron reissneri]|uniref:R3H domain-containing protein 4 n=1 Tax=Lethenteron reissneri TaxID=7753 RepID=UPI002AB7C795|nr:R3H domain-containing protein 4 [Lethenteron reissneri]
MVVAGGGNSNNNSGGGNDRPGAGEKGPGEAGEPGASPAKRTAAATRRKQFYVNRAVRNSDLVRQGKGRQRLRRQENAHYLMNLVDKMDPCGAEDADESDARPNSIFSEVLTKEDYIQIWNDFMNRPGEEQERLLRGLDVEEAVGSKLDPHGATHEPLPYSPKECYDRIDKHIRLTLRKKRVPLGTLEFLEENVTTFFCSCPEAVYLAMLENSFERMLLHGLCQYLDLASSSCNRDGRRQTRVVNKHRVFEPPGLALSAFLGLHA